MNSVSDESQVKDLRDQVEAEIDAVCLDGAYDARTRNDGFIDRKIKPVIRPQKEAVQWQ